jgi:hypothetical protein
VRLACRAGHLRKPLSTKPPERRPFRSLRQLGVDMVKIDGSFIQNLGTDAED